MYGLMLLVAIAASVALTGWRWVRWGGDWDLVFRVAVWGVAFGVVGARAYHDVTSWDEVPNHWWGFAAVWKGGLGVWGAIPFGVAAGAWVVRRSGNSIRLFMDAVAPGLLLAQGIGRWATTGIRSCTASTRRSRGRSRSTARVPRTSSTRRSCTSSRGTCSRCSRCSGSTGASR